MTNTAQPEPTHQRPALAASEAIELAYGLLWFVPDSDQHALSRLAREALRGQLDREARIRGVAAAQDRLAQHRRDAH
ncbi:hypothetical protein ACVWXO_008064 [Bradyrhizobium sp. LM2.7]